MTRSDLDPSARAWYERGWRYSAGPCAKGLEHGDAMGAPDAWYLGYLDYAAGRPKWSLGEGFAR